MPRRIGASLLILMFAFMTACAGSSGTTDSRPSGTVQQTLTLWSFATDNEEKLNKVFSQLHPGVKIEVTPVPWADYDRKLQVALATGDDLPDIVTVESYWWGKWQHMKGAFEDLSAYGIDARSVMDMSSEAMRGEDGGLTFVPVATGIGCIWYRKDLALKYFGYDESDKLEQALANWDDFLAWGALIKEKSQGKHYLFADTLSLEEFLIAANKDYMNGSTLLLTEKILPLFQLMEKMLKQGYIARYIGMDLDRSYVQGNVLFYPYADWRGDYIKSIDRNGAGKWGVMKPPGGVFVRGGYGYAIPKKSKPENKAAAAERIRFVLTAEGSRTVVLDTNQFSAYRGAYTQDILQTKDAYFGEDIQKKISAWAQEIKTPVRYGEYDDIIEKELRIQAYNMMMSGITAEQAMRNARDEIGSKLTGKVTIR